MSIQQAFQRAIEGAKCYNCQRRFNHAVYQRHVEACISNAIDSLTPDNPNVSAETSFLTIRTPIKSVRKAPRSDKKLGKKPLKRLINSRSSTSSSGALDEKKPYVTYESPPRRIRRVMNFSEVSLKSRQSVGCNSPSSSNFLRFPKQECVEDKNLSLEEVFDSMVSKIHKLISEQGWDSTHDYNATQQSSQRRPFSDVKNEPSCNNDVLPSCKSFAVLRVKPSHTNGRQGEFGSQSNADRAAILFFGPNLIPLHSLVNCSVDAQVLFVRLFLRRRGWCSIKPSAGLKSFPDVPTENLAQLFSELQRNGLVESIASQEISLDEGFKLLLLPEISKLCKEFRVNTRSTNRQSLIAKLKEVALSQRAIFSSSLQSTMLRSVKKLVGDACFRIPEAVWKLCLSLFTLYAPHLMDSSELIDGYVNLPQQLLFKMLQVRRGETRYLVPVRAIFSSMLDYYSSYADLLSYVEAKLTEERILHLGKKRDYENLILLGEQAKNTLISQHLENPEKMSFYESLPKYIRKFSGAWVLIRVVYHLVEAAQTIKDFESAVKLLRFLIVDEGVRVFCHSVRGIWYNRLTLDLDFHLKRKEEAVEYCLMGMADEGVGSPMVLALQNRLKKLVTETDFHCKIKLAEPKKMTIEGVVLGKNLGDQRTNRFYIRDKEDIGNCDVEVVALDYFMKNGFTEGLHAEGSSWHTVFGLLFADIIFAGDIPRVWVSELQANPLDLNSNSFYSSRQQWFDDRFNEILNSERESICRRLEDNFNRLRGYTNSEIHWDCFTDLAQIQRFVSCCTPELLTNVFRRMAMDYRNTRSGFPDLTLWNAETKRLAVVEVKGPNDSLSTKQCLWLDFFAIQGIEAVVCHVLARKSRMIE